LFPSSLSIPAIGPKLLEALAIDGFGFSPVGAKIETRTGYPRQLLNVNFVRFPRNACSAALEVFKHPEVAPNPQQ